MFRIALLTSMPSEDDYLPFHTRLQKISFDKHDIQLDLLKNGEFLFYLDNKERKVSYQGKNFSTKPYDLLFVRFAIKAPHCGDYYVVREFINQGIPVINSPSSIYLTRDKLATLQILAQAGLSVTPTVIVRNREQIAEALGKIGNPPYIIKNTFGSGGRCVLQATTRAQVYSIFDYIWHLDRNEILLLQPYVAEKPAKDVRVICFQNRPWLSMERIAQQGEFRANVKTGASTRVTKLSEQEKELCSQASQLTGLDLAGIDFIRTKSGPMILEVNGCPGFTGMADAYIKQDRDVIEELADQLAHYCQENLK